MTSMARVLVADDEPDLIEDYHCALALPESGSGNLRLVELQDELFGPQHSNSSLPAVELVAVQQGEAAVQAIARARDESRPFAVAFLDVRMPPGMNGLDAAMKIREIDENLPIVIVTAYTDIQMIDLAKKVPPADRLFVLQKPFHTTEIQQLTIALTARWELDRAGHSGNAGEDARHLEDVLRGLPGGIAVFDESERLVQTNGGLESLFPELKDQLRIGARYDTLQASIAERLLPEQVLKRRGAGASDGGGQFAERGGLAARRLAGNRWMMIAERPQNSGGAVVQFLDVTAMKIAEQRRAISSTMMHVSRFAEELVERIERGSRTAGKAADSAESMRHVLDDLLPLAQRLQLAPRVAIVDALVNEVAAVVEPKLPDSIELETVSSIGLWPVFIDAEHARVALRALIDNAVEALHGDGRVVVESMNVRATREAASELPGLKAGEYVCVTISDNGSGMSPELIDRAVMPYFTTKDPKSHSGMGLSTAYSIIVQSGGHLFIDSDGQSETKVSIFFPKAPAIATAGKRSLRRH